MNPLSPAREIAALFAQEVDVDQSNLRTAAPTLCSRACQEKEWSLPKTRSRSAAVFGAPFDLYRSGHAQYWTKLVSCLDFDRSCASTKNDGFS